MFGLQDGFISKGPILIALLHIVFTFPYIVRSIEAAIFQIDDSHEQAATMLGAAPLTVFRTVSLPLFKSGLISGAILCFTRSLSETGATMMVAGAFSTAPIAVVALKNASDIPSAVGVSIILILVAVSLLIITKLFSAKFTIPVVHVWPKKERILGKQYVWLRDLIVSAVVASIIILPTLYIVLSGLGVVRPDTFGMLLADDQLLAAIFVSFLIGAVVTVINLFLAIPLAILVTKNMFRIGNVIDTLSDVILLVPTSALGLSLSLYWGHFAFNEFSILVMAHLSFSFPLMLKPITASMKGVGPELEQAARTLGATPLSVFAKILYPLIRPGITAGIIMTFMRSLSETGATLAVTKNIETIPVLLVNLFKQGEIADTTILACILLFAIAFGFIIALKKTNVGGHG